MQMRCHEHLSKAKNVWFWASKIELDLGFNALFQIRKYSRLNTVFCPFFVIPHALKELEKELNKE